MAVTTIDSWISRREQNYVCVTGVHGVMESQQDDELRRIHNEAGMATPDGMPLVWLGRRAGAPHMERVYGPDLMLEVVSRGLDSGWRHYFYGGQPGVPQELSRQLQARFPGLEVVGAWSPPFRQLVPNEIENVTAAINATNADIVWVGLSTPKQERWMSEFRPRLNAPVLIGVGAAFDIHSARARQAPRWMRQRGLEWFYRLLHEPRRLAGRYLRNNPKFLLSIARRRPFLVRPL
jgi:N-acetylglucosaminyldiphosphoundecaprenol N-acetyl-beta-D-mannosaminyltransferase